MRVPINVEGVYKGTGQKLFLSGEFVADKRGIPKGQRGVKAFAAVWHKEFRVKVKHGYLFDWRTDSITVIHLLNTFGFEKLIHITKKYFDKKQNGYTLDGLLKAANNLAQGIDERVYMGDSPIPLSIDDVKHLL